MSLPRLLAILRLHYVLYITRRNSCFLSSLFTCDVTFLASLPLFTHGHRHRPPCRADQYLNDKLSDVTIVVDNVEYPVHRVILAQRCRYFDRMFNSNMIEATSKRIEIRETSIDAVKAVLKWIYTGTIDLGSLGKAVEILRLARMVELTEVVEVAVRYFEDNCTVDRRTGNAYSHVTIMPQCFQRALTMSGTEQISDLYLSEKLSDVTIVIDDVKIPAHRDILTQRCRYFEAMFDSGMIESTSNRIELHETPINGFKSVLKWIYTATVQLTSIDNAFEILRLAHMYELPELVTFVVEFLKDICSVETVCLILNEAILLSLDDLTDFAIDLVRAYSYQVLKHESFKRLSPDALNEILTSVVFCASEIDIFHAVVGWMKANPSKSAGFSSIFKNVVLDFITVRDMATLPSDVLDAVVDLIRQNETSGPTYCLKNENVAVPCYGVKVVNSGDASFFEEDVPLVLMHSIGSEDCILIDLGHRFLLNSFKMLLAGNEKKTYSYWIAVSEDNVNWIRAIEHSKYLCRSLQNLYFKPRPVRFIQIRGTAPVNGIFKISIFKASYTTEPFNVDPETTLVIPSDNLALTDKGAILVQGITNAVINGNFQGHTHFSGYTRHNIGEPGIIVQLPQPYLVDAMKLRLWDHDDRVYSYNIEVSVDQVNWTRVFSEERVSSWREVHFEKQPVVFIKLTGTYNSANTSFQCVHLECFASKKC